MLLLASAALFASSFHHATLLLNVQWGWMGRAIKQVLHPWREGPTNSNFMTSTLLCVWISVYCLQNTDLGTIKVLLKCCSNFRSIHLGNLYWYKQSALIHKTGMTKVRCTANRNYFPIWGKAWRSFFWNITILDFTIPHIHFFRWMK